VAVNASARFNVANAELDDRAGSALDGDHTFTRINPAFGVTCSPIKELTFFTGYSEANRAPSASELACADPDRPCRVPNAFIADPPLSQVVSRSVEVGLRGHAATSTRANARSQSSASAATRLSQRGSPSSELICRSNLECRVLEFLRMSGLFDLWRDASGDGTWAELARRQGAARGEFLALRTDLSAPGRAHDHRPRRPPSPSPAREPTS
jgi:hypothetical protein